MSKKRITPKSIFKYRNFKNPEHTRIITNQEIYLAKKSELQKNDPEECNYRIDRNPTSIENLRRIEYARLIGTSDLLHPEIEELLKNTVDEDILNTIEQNSREWIENRLGVFCSSRIYSNENLWRDFGDSKKGFCVELEIHSTFPQLICGDVNYIPINGLTEKSSIADTNELINRFFSVNNEYSSEREFRIIKTINSVSERFKIIPKESILSITCGEKMSKPNKEKFIELIENHLHGVKIFEMNYKNQRKLIKT